MNPLALITQVLPDILRTAIPVPSGTGYMLELDGTEMEVLRELSAKLETKARWERNAPPVDGR